LDLWSVTLDSLLAAGVRRDHIWLSEICTASHPSVLCSYRREGAAAGRIVAAIRPAAQPVFA
jgi:copper oxidase (laccase) domain-containing protein